MAGSSKWALKKQIAFLTALEYISELSYFMGSGSGCLMLHSKSVLYGKRNFASARWDTVKKKGGF